MSFSNVYDDPTRAEAYARLEFPGTYHLAFRDLPAILSEHVVGRAALDFGCGAGRSTRFLRRLGFEPVGIDIAPDMIRLAAAANPSGDYRLVEDGTFDAFPPGPFDLILSAFAFDNMPGVEARRDRLAGLARRLAPDGRFVLLGSRPEIYTHEWASFTTRAYPENRRAKSGEAVRVMMKDVGDDRPVVDLLWQHEDYLHLFASAGLDLVAEHAPLGRADEPYAWVSETRVAPWIIYVLKKGSAPRSSP